MRNPTGATRHPNKEWGKKSRKEADRQGVKKTARRDAIAEQKD